MNKRLRSILIILASLVAIGYVAFRLLGNYTKSHSPEVTVGIAEAGANIEIFYNRPSKKGRVIFGELVPYGTVWRTGANEATTFTTDKTLVIGGKELAAGTYTLWTIPGEQEWSVIFNSKMYAWGVNFNAEASRKAEFDVLETKVAVEQLSAVVDTFTITLNHQEVLNMSLAWDQTKVSVPITVK